MFTEMFSSKGEEGAIPHHLSPPPPPSTERIHKFMNAIYVDRPKDVTLFNINYKSHMDRTTVKGLRVGPSLRLQKNVVLVSGLPLQDPSAIGVNLYIAAALSRSPLARDVSVIPLAQPNEYERRWRRAAERAPSLVFPSSLAPFRAHHEPEPSASLLPKEPLSQPISENISVEFQDSCKAVEAYVTRHNKYYINVGVDMTANGMSAQYKSNSLRSLVSRGKSSSFFLDPTATPSDPSLPPPFPGHILGQGSLIAPYTEAPTLVLELKSATSLSDDQIVTRGQEVIDFIKEVLN